MLIIDLEGLEAKGSLKGTKLSLEKMPLGMIQGKDLLLHCIFFSLACNFACIFVPC